MKTLTKFITKVLWEDNKTKRFTNIYDSLVYFGDKETAEKVHKLYSDKLEDYNGLTVRTYSVKRYIRFNRKTGITKCITPTVERVI